MFTPASTFLRNPERQVSHASVHASTVKCHRPTWSTLNSPSQRSLSLSYCIGIDQAGSLGERTTMCAAVTSWPSLMTSAPTCTTSPTMRFTG